MKKKKTKNEIYEEEPLPGQEDLYEDYYPAEDPYTDGGAHLTPEERERYYAERDAYYARRDAYYAERDAYYARQEEEEDEEWEEEPSLPAPRADRRDFVPEDAWEPPEKVRKKAARRRSRRRGRFFRRLLILLLAGALVLLLMGRAPVRNPDGRERIPGRSTVLLAGTDQDGTRTDTIMLLSLDQRGRSLGLLSIPRDTYSPGYAAYKINSAYGAAGGGERGMEELMGQVQRVVGFMPDAYVLLDMDVFVQAVDLLGGVDYNVPVDMYYEDGDQGLRIALQAGEQHLNGEQVMGLVRFRAGYATADIGRTEVQRDFFKTALRQWLRPSHLREFPALWRLYRENMTSDLTTRNLLWIARVLLKADISGMTAEVLPGWADMVDGSSVYMIDQGAAAAMLEKYSPYP